MLNSEQALKDGNLEQALSDSQQLVRKDPANARHRIYLFQLYAVLGQWEKALTQLNVLAEMDPETLAMVQTYRETLCCETLRTEVFSGQRSPLIMGEPEPWIAMLLESLRLTADQQHSPAGELRQQAFEAAPASQGMIDDEEFDWIADADSRLGPILEAIVNGLYYWIPFNRISIIRITPPEDLRDLVWTPAHFTWANGGETVGFIPTRYSGSEHSPDSGIRLARKTEWTKLGEEAYSGLGQRVLTTDKNDHALMDIRNLHFNHTDQ
jgi:type VI secretion system protein ImpE